MWRSRLGTWLALTERVGAAGLTAAVEGAFGLVDGLARPVQHRLLRDRRDQQRGGEQESRER